MSFLNKGNGAQDYNPNGDTMITDRAPEDGISDLAWSPAAFNFLAVASWDSKLRVYDVNNNLSCQGMQDQGAPILSCTWSQDGGKIFTGGADNRGMCWDVQGNKFIQVAAHDQPIKYVGWMNENGGILCTGSWDNSLRYWDMRQQAPICTVNLGNKLYCMDIKWPLGIACTSDRKIHIFNMQQPQNPVNVIESPLKMQSRCVSCFYDDQGRDPIGFALGSIEGRVAIQYVSPNIPTSQNFAFKCHRKSNSVYPVNSIDFHPKFGTFSTSGGDGGFNFWDKDSKQRLKQFNTACTSISVGKFNANGEIFGYAVSYDWCEGIQGFNPDMKNVILLRKVMDNEIKSRSRNNRRK